MTLIVIGKEKRPLCGASACQNEPANDNEPGMELNRKALICFRETLGAYADGLPDHCLILHAACLALQDHEKICTEKDTRASLRLVIEALESQRSMLLKGVAKLQEVVRLYDAHRHEILR